MIIYNQICIEGISDLVENIVYSDDDDDDLIPINTPSGVTLNAVSTDLSMKEFINKYPNLTYADLG